MINHYAVTPEFAAGTRHYDFAAELTKKGLSVTIFASNYTLAQQEISLEKKENYKFQEAGGVQFCWIKTPHYTKNDWRRLKNMVCFSFNLLRVGRKLKSSPWLIIGSSPHLFAALGGFFLSRLKGSKFFLEVRDLWPQFLVEVGGVSPYHPAILVMRIMESFLYRRAEKIVILAPGSRDYLLEKGVQEEKIVYVPNGVHLDSFLAKKSREEARNRYGFDRFTLVYAGAHGPANALDNVIKAADYLRDEEQVEFVLVGRGVSKEALVEEVSEKGLTNVRFLDPVPRSEVPTLLKAADAGLITLKNVPSFAFGVSPNKLFDYMASELPIISAVGGEISRIVEENGLGYAVEPEDAEGLAEAVRELYGASEEERERMGKAGRKLVEARYSRQKLAEKLLEVAMV